MRVFNMEPLFINAIVSCICVGKVDRLKRIVYLTCALCSVAEQILTEFVPLIVLTISPSFP